MPGDRVHAGGALGKILDVYGDTVETMTAPPGTDIVLGISTYPAAATGGWLFEFGTGLREASAEAETPEAPRQGR